MQGRRHHATQTQCREPQLINRPTMTPTASARAIGSQISKQAAEEILGLLAEVVAAAVIH